SLSLNPVLGRHDYQCCARTADLMVSHSICYSGTVGGRGEGERDSYLQRSGPAMSGNIAFCYVRSSAILDLA
ncbi:Hypothetical predicted protein, partial [Pelobates cultripes]